jgi:hypothetical protein
MVALEVCLYIIFRARGWGRVGRFILVGEFSCHSMFNSLRIIFHVVEFVVSYQS